MRFDLPPARNWSWWLLPEGFSDFSVIQQMRRVLDCWYFSGCHSRQEHKIEKWICKQALPRNSRTYDSCGFWSYMQSSTTIISTYWWCLWFSRYINICVLWDTDGWDRSSFDRELPVFTAVDLIDRCSNHECSTDGTENHNCPCAVNLTDSRLVRVCLFSIFVILPHRFFLNASLIYAGIPYINALKLLCLFTYSKWFIQNIDVLLTSFTDFAFHQHMKQNTCGIGFPFPGMSCYAINDLLLFSNNQGNSFNVKCTWKWFLS